MTFKANAPASKACTPPTPPACRSVRARRSSSAPNFVTITTSIPGRSRTSTAYLPLPPISFFGGEEQEVPTHENHTRESRGHYLVGGLDGGPGPGARRPGRD